MVPVVTEIASENKDTFVVAKLDMDDNKETILKYQVRGRPAYIVFQDGEIVGRFVNAKPKADLLREIFSVIDVEEN